MLYGHPYCPMVGPVKRLLDGAGVEYEYVNIHQDEAGRSRVREINDGNESVPTLIFPDGSTLTEPSTSQLRAKLSAAGYTIPLSAVVMANLPRLVILAVVVYGLLRLVGVL